MEFQREEYVEKLAQRRGNGLVKVITGIRRCGKSYLLFRLFKGRLLKEGVKPNHIVEIALDVEKFEDLRDPMVLAKYVRGKIKADGTAWYVFIDEIQYSRKVLRPGVDLSKVAPEDIETCYVTFYDVLNELRLMSNVEVYVTGSNSRLLSKDVATNFRDRGFEIRVFPLSFAECCAALPGEKGEILEDYFAWGGMPQAVLEKDVAVRERYLKDLFDKVYLKDIRERHKLRDDYVLDGVVDVVSSAIGSLTNPHKLVNTLKSVLKVDTTDVTMKRYLEYLEDSFLFSKARRYDVRGKAYLDRPVKYYAEDVGLRNARLDFREGEKQNQMENVIYNELLRRGYSVDVGVVNATVREGESVMSRQYEIDFVVNRGNLKLYIQSAYELADKAKRDQESESLKRSGDFFAKIIVINGFQRPRADQDGIVTVGLIPFLLEPAILDGAFASAR